MKRKELTQEQLINGWLQKYHNISVVELIEKEPELVKTSDWFEKYAVSQEQHDEWYEWAIEQVCKYFRCGKKHAKRAFAFDYLNIAPAVKEEEGT